MRDFSLSFFPVSQKRLKSIPHLNFRLVGETRSLPLFPSFSSLVYIIVFLSRVLTCLLCVSCALVRFSDLEGEQDSWSRRHVPLVFHHATFPLSLQQLCERILERQNERADGAEKQQRMQEKKKKKRGGQEVKIDASLIKPIVVPAPSSDSSSSSGAPSAASLSGLVSRIDKTRLARNCYGGVASTLNRLRKAAGGEEGRNRSLATSSTTAAPASTAASKPLASSSGSKSTASAAASGSSSAAAAALAFTPLNSHFGNPLAFHPQVTKQLIDQHQKQTGMRPAAKKQKVSDAF